MMRYLSLAALLLLFAPVASADPISLVATLAPIVGGSVAAFVVANAAAIAFIGLQVYGAANARRKARRNAARQRSEYNSSLEDRSVSALQAAPPWRVIYGDVVTGGDIVGIFTTDKSGVRTDGTAYTKPDGLKHLVIVIAAHECEAIDDVLIDGVSLGTLDGTGRPTSGEFAVVRTESREIAIAPGGSSVQPYAVTVLSAVDTALSNNTSGDGSFIVYGTYTLTAGNTTINNTTANEIRVAFTMEVPQASVRVQKHLGSDTQTVDTYLNGLIPTQWTTNHRLRGICYAIVTLDLETQRFQGGPPGITFRVRGRRVFDTRTSTTAYSTNPALCIRDYLTSKWGFEVPTAGVDTAFCNAAANACDALISLDVGGVVTTNQPTYTLNGVVTTEDSKESVLEDMCEAMAGYAVYGATWQIIAGAWTAPVMDLADADLVGQIEIVQADVGTEDLFNGVRGTYIGAGKSSPTDFDSYQNATFVTADGQELWADITLPFTDNKARARNLARIFVERNRNGQVIRYPAKLRAWPLQVGDRVRVTSAEYGWTLKTYRVTDWQFGITSPVLLTLQEDAAAAWDLADAATADPTPNTDLPNPNVVQSIAGLAAASGSTELIRQGDGTITTRVRVSWSAMTDAYVTDGGGRLQIVWRRHFLDAVNTWQQLEVPGTETRAFIVGAAEGDLITIGVRAINSLGRVGNTSWIQHVVVGKTAPPVDVTGLAAVGVGGGIQITWAQNEEIDYYTTELRFGASWAAGTVITQVAGSQFFWSRTSTAGVTIWARHQDTSGNYSSGIASVASAALQETVPLNWDFTSGTDGWSNVDSVATTSDASGGSYGVASTPAAEYIGGRSIPIALDRKYRVRARVRRPSGGTGVGIVIIGATCFDSTGALINNPGGTGFPAAATTASGVTVPNNNTWMVIEGEISGVNVGSSPWTDMRKFWPGTVRAAPNIYWDATFNGNLHIDYVEIVDVTDAQISVAQSFSAFRTWDFAASLEGWAVQNATAVAGATSVTITPTTSDPMFRVSGLSIPGALYDKVRIRVRRANAGTGWDGTLYYTTAGHGETAGFLKALAFSSMPGDQFAVLEFDMADLTAGGTDWRDSVITGLRFDLANSTTTNFEVDWISVGRYGPAGDLALVSNSTWVANSLMTMFGDRAVRTSLAAGAWSGQVYSLDAYTGGAYITGVVQRQGDNVFIGLNTDPATDGNYTSIDYSIHWNGAGAIYAFNGATAMNGGASIGTYAVGDVLGVFYDGQFVRYMQNGATLFTQAASSSQLKLYADTSFFNVGDSVGGLTFGPMTNTSASRGSNLIDASWWQVGVAPLSRWNSNQSGAGAAEDFVLNQMPDGSTQVVWRATQGAGAGAGGGWNPGVNAEGNYIPIDTNKTYMFAVLFRQSAGVNDSSLWWGHLANTVCDLNTTTPNSNPYHAGGFNPGVTGRWYLAVGWVHPYGSTGNDSLQAGVWDTLTGIKVYGGANLNWAQGTQYASTRAYQYYGTAGNHCNFARPQAYLCDGSQPTLRDLLSSVANYGQDAMRVGFFNGWSDNFPDGWADWANGATLIKETARVRTAPYAVKWSNISTEQGLVSTNEFVGAPRAEGDYIEGEFEAFIESNAGSGYPGILVRAFFAGGLTLFEDLFVPVTNLIAGAWQRVPFKHSLLPGRSICAVHIYMMASWSSAPGGNSNCTVVFDNIQYRFQRRVDTLQLASGAATSTGAATATGVSVTNAYFSPDGYTRNTQITTVSFTPIITCEVLITATLQGDYTTGAANNNMSQRASIQEVGGTWNNALRYESYQGNVGVSTYRGLPLTLSRRVTVTAGVAYTFGLYAAKFDGTDTLTFNNVEMRYEVIKR